MNAGEIIFATRNIYRRVQPSESSDYFPNNNQNQSIVQSGAFIGTTTGASKNGYVEVNAYFKITYNDGSYAYQKMNFWVYESYVRIGSKSELSSDDVMQLSQQNQSNDGIIGGVTGGLSGGTLGGIKDGTKGGTGFWDNPLAKLGAAAMGLLLLLWLASQLRSRKK